MVLKEFLDKVMNINETIEQYKAKVYFKSEYYEVCFKRLYIVDIKVKENMINIHLNDGRIIKLAIVENLTYWVRYDY